MTLLLPDGKMNETRHRAFGAQMRDFIVRRFKMLRSRRWAIMPLLAAAAVVATATVARADEAETRKALEDVYAAVDASLMKADADAIMAHEADDFTQVKKDGKVLNKEEADAKLVQAMKDLPGIGKVTGVKTTMDKFEANGDAEATVEVTDKMALNVTDKDGVQHAVVILAQSRETWVKVGDDWKIKKSVELDSSTTVDGKPA